MRTLLLVIAFALFCARPAAAQVDSASKNAAQIPDRELSRISRESQQLSEQLSGTSRKYLQQLSEKEDKIRKKLSKIDSVGAIHLFSEAKSKYGYWMQKLSGVSTAAPAVMGSTYIPSLDSLHTGLSFLNKNQQLLSSAKSVQVLSGALSHVQELQANFSAAGDIQQFISKREALLKTQLGQYGLNGQLSGFSQKAYYYQQQVAEYKSMLHDKDKLKTRALSELSKIPAYQKFLQKNSLIGQIFGLPASYGSAESMESLQTKSLVGQMMKQSGGGLSRLQVNQQLSGGQEQVAQLQDKVTQLVLPGAASGSLIMPDFRPDAQKTKSFFRRLEYGFNVQSQKSSILLPNETDVALSLGYRISDKSTAGIGMSYKIGLGSGLNHIAFSSLGVGIRSYIDIKAKGSIWISGGFEYNYLQAFSKLSVVENLDLWQKSALIGLSKKYKISPKKQGNLQLLFDFLYRQHNPWSQPVVFRTGFQL